MKEILSCIHLSDTNTFLYLKTVNESEGEKDKCLNQVWPCLECSCMSYCGFTTNTVF